jgi:hypothetical protein
MKVQLNLTQTEAVEVWGILISANPTNVDVANRLRDAIKEARKTLFCVAPTFGFGSIEACDLPTVRGTEFCPSHQRKGFCDEPNHDRSDHQCLLAK